MIYFNLKWQSRKKQNDKTKRSFWYSSLQRFLALHSSNPDFDDKIDDVVYWFIEYDDVGKHIANREIGIDQDGKVFVKMPDESNYGYWLDTDCDLTDFNKMGINMIAEKEFDDLCHSVYYDIEAKDFKPVANGI